MLFTFIDKLKVDTFCCRIEERGRETPKYDLEIIYNQQIS